MSPRLNFDMARIAALRMRPENNEVTPASATVATSPLTASGDHGARESDERGAESENQQVQSGGVAPASEHPAKTGRSTFFIRRPLCEA